MARLFNGTKLLQKVLQDFCQGLSYPKAQVAQSVSSKQSSYDLSCNSNVQRCFSWCHVQSNFPSDGILWLIGQRGF